MFNRIILAADGSPHAERAAEAAIQLMKEITTTGITVLYVCKSIPSRMEIVRSRFDIRSILLWEAEKALSNISNKFIGANIPYHLEVALGDPANQIISFAERGKYELIIVGSRGLNRFKEVILGSVSQQVLHDASCPVLIVK